jgi:hypothetical protein
MSVPEPIQRLIESSGNTFHAKVAKWLRDDGWHIRVSPYYMDQSQNKAREIDLIAEKSWPIQDMFNRFLGDVVVRLFVECKFVPTHAVFWFTDKDVVAAKKHVCSTGSFRRDNIYTDKHHYLAQNKKVAKLFASESGKGQDFEPFYKALNQVLNAQVSLGDQLTAIHDLSGRSRGKQILINYPVVVCNSFDRTYGLDFYGGSAPEQITENFLLEVQYAYIDRSGQQRDDYFLVDFVEFDKLQKLTEAITRDAEVAKFLASED